MKLLVLSRSKAKKLSYKQDLEPSVIISITDIGEAPAVFNHNSAIKSVLHLQFGDLITEQPEAMTESDAEKIVEFVKLWKDKVEQVIIHCEAGISRSAGVGGALALWLNGSDMEIFSNPQFDPNRLCYRKIINELVRQELL